VHPVDMIASNIGAPVCDLILGLHADHITGGYNALSTGYLVVGIGILIVLFQIGSLMQRC
jgi:hypothetical protein